MSSLIIERGTIPQNGNIVKGWVDRNIDNRYVELILEQKMNYFVIS